MFATIVRPFRALYRAMTRVAIETREQEELTQTRKLLLSFRAARESAGAMRAMLRERVDRLTGELAVAMQGLPEKRTFDWIRFDNNNLVAAIKDDLYEAEKQLHEQEHNFEHNECNVAMLERREDRLVASLDLRKHRATQPKAAQPVSKGTKVVDAFFASCSAAPAMQVEMLDDAPPSAHLDAKDIAYQSPISPIRGSYRQHFNDAPQRELASA